MPSKTSTIDMSKHERLAIYGVRNYEKDGEDRSFWTQVGSAFRCKDGSFNLVLDYVPTGGGTLNLRPARSRDEA